MKVVFISNSPIASVFSPKIFKVKEFIKKHRLNEKEELPRC